MTTQHWKLAGGVGFLTVIIAMAVFYNQHRRVATVPKPVTHSADRPSESAIPKAYAWRGGALDPKYIRLPSISAGGFIQVMGVDQHHQVAAPDNINLAGWYVNSVRPGEQGLSIIDGHLDGYRKPGIFKRLASLKLDDRFSVERGDGKVLAYRVTRIAAVNTRVATDQLFARDTNTKSQLNIVTCDGAFNQASRAYEQRVIVTSELIHP